jgi:hypothetical protein
MIVVCLIIVIIIIIILGIAFWLYNNKKNDTSEEHNIILLNTLLENRPKLDKYQTHPRYEGSIDNDILDINKSIKSALKTNLPIVPENIANGHPELRRNENANAPYGNAFNRTNISAPFATPIEVTKELNADILDFDEKNAYQSLGRNDPYRPINGIMNREKMMDPYLREELEEASKKEWWGNGEY